MEGKKCVYYVISMQMCVRWGGNYSTFLCVTFSVIIILVLPPGVVCQSNCVLPMPGTADGDVVSRCQVLGEQAVSLMGQTSRCCMVCLMPQSQVSGSLEKNHFNMFTFSVITMY